MQTAVSQSAVIVKARRLAAMNHLLIASTCCSSTMMMTSCSAVSIHFYQCKIGIFDFPSDKCPRKEFKKMIFFCYTSSLHSIDSAPQNGCPNTMAKV
jgi:hypothetical protein